MVHTFLIRKLKKKHCKNKKKFLIVEPFRLHYLHLIVTKQTNLLDNTYYLVKNNKEKHLS